MAALLRAPLMCSAALRESYTYAHVTLRSASTAAALSPTKPAPIRAGQKVSVILKEQLDNVGYAGQEVQVAPGFARNFLIPRQIAVYATELNRATHKRVLPPDEASAKAAEMSTAMLKRRIMSITLLFNRATSDGSALYGAITRADIVEALADTPLRNLKIKEANVRIGPEGAPGPQQLTTVGEHIIQIEPAKLGYVGMWCNLKVSVRSS